MLNSVLFRFGGAFSQIGELAWKKASDSGNTDFILPAVVCDAFSIELLLKLFVVLGHHPQAKTVDQLVSRGVKFKGHNYSGCTTASPPIFVVGSPRRSPQSPGQR
jgi:hypothetical protein